MGIAPLVLGNFDIYDVCQNIMLQRVFSRWPRNVIYADVIYGEIVFAGSNLRLKQADIVPKLRVIHPFIVNDKVETHRQVQLG